MSEEKSLGKLIREARKQLGLSQQELADKFDTVVSRITVGRWEKDEQRPTIQNFEELIGILDLNEQEAYALYYAGGKMPPERQNLPLPNRFFTGRKVYLKELRELLEKHHVVALSGLGGIGKTQIALKYAHQHHPDMYPTALWVNAADTATLQAGFASLAETLKLPEKDEQKLEPRIKAVREWLEAYTNWLLIMDNADELPDVEEFLLSRPRGHIILTTRWQPAVSFAELFSIEVMGAEEGRDFLLGRTNRSPEGAELDAVDQLVEELGGHALALEQAGAYTQQTGTSFTDYLKLYEKNRLSLLSRYGALKDKHNKHRLTVAATFKGSLARAQELSPLAEDILRFCAFLQPDAIPQELFEHDEGFTADTMALKEGIAALQQYSLIKPSDMEVLFSVPHPSISMHRLVQAVLVDAMSFDLQKEWRGRIVRALDSAFPLVEFKDWYQCARLLPHLSVCATWTKDEFAPTAEYAELFHKAYVYLSKRGDYSVGEVLLTHALPVYKQHFGDKHLVTASALFDLARLHQSQGDYRQAGRLFQQAYTIQSKQLGATHPDTLSSLTELTLLYDFGPREPVRIGRLLAQVHEAAEDDQVAIDLETTANLCRAQGKYEQAKFACRRALAIRKQLLGTEHPLTKGSQENYAEFLRSISNHTEATASEKNDRPSV